MIIKTIRLRSLVKSGILLALAGALAWELWDSNNVLDVAAYTLTLKNLPRAFDGYRVVQLSDLHERSFGNGNSALLGRVAAAQPDLIAVTGDIVEKEPDLEYVYETAQGLASIAPTYFVPGNHEYSTRSFAAIEKTLKDAGVTVLRNRTVALTRGGESIALTGIDDPNGPFDMKPMGEVIAEVRKAHPGRFILCLSHRYDRFEEYVELGLDLVLTGHAHGGLVRLPFTDGLIGPGGRPFPQHTSGVYEEAGTVMVTSRGLGNSAGAPRLFNRPHMPLLILKCAD